MANKGAKSGYRGHGPSLGRKRYAWPTTRRLGRMDAAYLKTWGSRPEAKLKRQEKAA